MKKNFILITTILLLQMSCDDFSNPVDPYNQLPNFDDDLTIMSTSEHELHLSWPTVSGADEYIIERRSDLEEDFYIIASIEKQACDDGCTYTDSNLNSNELYWYKVYGKSGYNTTTTLIETGQPYFPKPIKNSIIYIRVFISKNIFNFMFGPNIIFSFYSFTICIFC